MTIDEAIKHCEEEAEKYMEYGIETECYQCGKEHEQLAEWLKELKHLKEEVKLMKPDLDSKNAELKEAKKLLRLAVDGFEYIHPYMSRCNGHCNNCPFDNEGWCCINWKYADEALKLIGGRRNDTDM